MSMQHQDTKKPEIPVHVEAKPLTIEDLQSEFPDVFTGLG
jgi:hypothetical protein